MTLQILSIPPLAKSPRLRSFASMAQMEESVRIVDRTHWSMIFEARDGDDLDRFTALSRLLNRYYKPISQQIQAGLPPLLRTPENVQDLTQGFIEHCLQTDFLRNVSPERGKFRTFIRVCIGNFLRQEHHRRHAQCRDSRRESYSLDDHPIEGSPHPEPEAQSIPPDKVLDRQWAIAVFDRAVESLAKECQRARRAELFKALRPHLVSQVTDMPATDVAAQLGMTEGAIHVALHRLRKRLGELVGKEVRDTIGTQEDWREELRYLVNLLGQQ